VVSCGELWLFGEPLRFFGRILAGSGCRGRAFFVEKTWTKRGCSVVVVLVSLVVFVGALGWSGGRRLGGCHETHRTEERAEILIAVDSVHRYLRGIASPSVSFILLRGLFKSDGTCVSENPFAVSIVGDPSDSIPNQADLNHRVRRPFVDVPYQSDDGPFAI